MALKIRLRQQGKKNQYVYRLVLTESRTPRDGKYIELLGWYNPFEEEAEKSCSVQAERIQHWLDQGAIISERAEALLKRTAPKVFEAYRHKVLARLAKKCEKKKAGKKKKEAVAK